MDAKALDVVRLKDGRTATIVEVYADGYMVEVSDATGRTLDMLTVGLQDIDAIIWVA